MTALQLCQRVALLTLCSQCSFHCLHRSCISSFLLNNETKICINRIYLKTLNVAFVILMLLLLLLLFSLVSNEQCSLNIQANSFLRKHFRHACPYICVQLIYIFLLSRDGFIVCISFFFSLLNRPFVNQFSDKNCNLFI